LEKVEFKGDITSIEKSAFNGCKALAEFVIPQTVGFIGDYAFKDCSSLRDIDIPVHLSSIGVSAFQGCSLLNLVTYEGTDPLDGKNVFSGCYSLDYLCVLLDYPEEYFCGLKPCRAPSCQAFRDSTFNCYKSLCNMSKGGMWDGCVDIKCAGETEEPVRTFLCGEDAPVCINNTCTKADAPDEGIRVEINMENVHIDDLNTTELIEVIISLTGDTFNSSDIEIGVETDEEGQVVRVIVYCNDMDAATAIEAAVNSIEKGDECDQGVLCNNSGVVVAFQHLDGAYSMHEITFMVNLLTCMLIFLMLSHF